MNANCHSFTVYSARKQKCPSDSSLLRQLFSKSANSVVSKYLYHLVSVQRFLIHSLCSTTLNNKHTTSNNQSSGPWTFVCGKCPREFSTKSARDTHHEGCNRPTNGTTQASRCLHDTSSFPTGTDSG